MVVACAGRKSGQATSVKNPANKTITYTYLDHGLRKGDDRAGGGLFTYTYDNASQTTVIENPQNDLTTFEYDDAGQRTGVRRAGSRTSLVYNAASQVTATVNELGKRRSFTYDAAGQRTAVQDARGNRTTFQYEAASGLDAPDRPARPSADIRIR